MYTKGPQQRRQTVGAHTQGTETILDEMEDESTMVQGLSPKRYAMLAMFALAVYINEVPLFGDPRRAQQSNYIEYFAFFPLYYTSIHWLEEVGHYQTMIFAMVFQCISILVSKTANEQSQQGQMEEYIGEILSAIAQVYLINGITKFSGAWFDNKWRPLSTAIIILFGHLGQNTVQWIHLTWFRNLPFDGSGKDIYEILDEFKLVLFILNVILTVVILIMFQSKPQEYPTLSQKYHRCKMYEPHLDIKYLLQYKEFKIYGILCGVLLTAINAMQFVPAAFEIVEFQNSKFITQDIMQIAVPIVFILGLLGGAIILQISNQSNQSYRKIILAMILIFIASIVFSIIAFIAKSAWFYAIEALCQNFINGALKLFLFEFITEIIFPVSPVFGLAILNSLSGILSLLLTMITDEIAFKTPESQWFVYVTQIICLAIGVFAFYVFLKYPYKLNRTDYDMGRRSTMITSFMKSGGASINADYRMSADVEPEARQTLMARIDNESSANTLNKMLIRHD